MSYLDEIHARATIQANALPRYHRVFPERQRRRFRGWLRRWFT